MGKLRRAIGLMSGTSLDGIDVALIETDGEAEVRRLGGMTVPYPESFRERLRLALRQAQVIAARSDRPGDLAAIERELTELHAEAVARFFARHGLQPGAIDVIGFHGQTVLHRDVSVVVSEIGEPKAVLDAPRIEHRIPGGKMTVQLGDGPLLARTLGIDVVYDLRAADCAHGGQGAPLVPIYHRALAARIPQRPLGILNVGGVANLTWIGRRDELIAFDTGPGNALLDDWMSQHAGELFDRDGETAARGTVVESALTALLTHDYFGRVPPKSLDRNAFALDAVAGLPLPDGAATLTAFTVGAVAQARAHLPEEPQLWIVCGGGRHNRTLMEMLAARVDGAVAPAEVASLDGDYVEAEAWGYLAVRSLQGLPITFPGTTGVPEALTGGVLAAGR